MLAKSSISDWYFSKQVKISEGLILNVNMFSLSKITILPNIAIEKSIVFIGIMLMFAEFIFKALLINTESNINKNVIKIGIIITQCI